MGRLSGFILLGFGLAAGLHVDRADPVEEATRALAEGRYWHASRLLEKVEGARPPTIVLAARADAGRGAWTEVVRRLEPQVWIDSVESGLGRALLARAWLETGHHERAARNFEIYLRYALGREARAYAEIGLARALASLGRGHEAATAYARGSELLPPLEPWLALRAAEGLASTGDTAAVRERLERASGTPVWRQAAARAESQTRAGDEGAAVQTLLNAAVTVPAEKATPLRVSAARIQLQRNDSASARSILRAALEGISSESLDAADLLSSLPGLTATDHLALGRAYERAGAPARAVPEYRAYLARGRPSVATRLKMQVQIGELLMNTGAPSAAIRELESVLDARPTRSLAARADLLIARATYRSGRRSIGRQRLREVADRYPGTGTGLRALSLLADLYEYSGDAERAGDLYIRMATDYPWSHSGARARFRLGILAFLDGDYTAARTHFDRCRRVCRDEIGSVQAVYWAARARLSTGSPADSAEAEHLLRRVRARDPFGYYGLLAAERLRIDPWNGLSDGPESAELDPETARRLELFESLRRAGLRDEAAEVLRTVIETPPDGAPGLLALSSALAREGLGGHAVRLGWTAHSRLRGQWSEDVLRAIYPLPYPEIIFAEARGRNLDPFLLAAVARQESHFTPDAVSHAGARGLLQLMPATARQWAGRTGVSDYRDELLDDPEINVHLGAAFLAYLHQRYDEVQIALVAYNAGPTRARRWQERPAYRADAELFVERIPFSETRNYVKGVQRHRRIYEHLYGPQLETGSAGDE